MPLTRWTRRDIEIGVELRHQGKTFLEVAKVLTEKNLKELLPENLFEAANAVNQERTQRESIRQTFEMLMEKVPELDSIKAEIQDALVSMHRLHYLSKTKRWKEYEDVYTQSYNRRVARRGATS